MTGYAGIVQARQVWWTGKSEVTFTLVKLTKTPPHMPQSALSKYRFYSVNSVRFDNLSGMNKVFLFKGQIVSCLHGYWLSLERGHGCSTRVHPKTPGPLSQD